MAHQKRFPPFQKERKTGNFVGIPLRGALRINVGVVFPQAL